MAAIEKSRLSGKRRADAEWHRPSSGQRFRQLLIKARALKSHQQSGAPHQVFIKAFGLVLLAIVFGGSMLLPGAAALSSPAVQFPKFASLDPRLNEAIASIDQGSYEEAVGAASKLIDSQTLDQPSLGYAYCLRGDARAILKQYAPAIVDIETGLSKNPDTEGKAELYAIRANCMIGLGKYSEALNSFNLSLESGPSGMGFYSRGLLNLRLKKYADALHDLDQSMGFSDCPDDIPELKELAQLKLAAANAANKIVRNRHHLDVRGQRAHGPARFVNANSLHNRVL